MPFDGTFAPNSLEAAARLIGVTPIPMAELEAYKAAEVEKHSASWWWYHKELGRTISIVSCFTMMLSGFFVLHSGAAITALISAMIFVTSTAILVGTSTFKAKGPAKWLEFNGIASDYPPDEIASLARHMQYVVEDSHIVIGKLIQDTYNLDPYLLLCAGDERICLGIWDKTGIVRIAK